MDKKTMKLAKAALAAVSKCWLPEIGGFLKVERMIVFTDRETFITVDACLHIPDGVYFQAKAKAALAGMQVQPDAGIDEFPAIPAVGGCEMRAPADFWQSVRDILPAVSTDQARYVLTTPAYDNGWIVATDGRRLHVHKGTNCLFGYVNKRTEGKVDKYSARNIGNDGKLWKAWLSYVEDSMVCWDDERIAVTCGGASCIAKTTEGTYPGYKQVIPVTDETWKYDEVPLAEIDDYIKLAGRKSEPELRWHDGTLTIRTRYDAFPSKVLRASEYDKCVRADYLSEACHFVGGNVLNFVDSLAPFVVDNGTRLAVLMPMRVE